MRQILIRLTALLLALTLPAAAWAEMTVHFLDVGHGD